MEWNDTTRGIVIGLAGTILVVGGFVVGVLFGVAVGERIEASWISSVSAGVIARSQRTLQLLDEGSYQRLREEANVALDTALFTTCVGLGPEGSEPEGAEVGARRLVRRVAEYRQGVPPSYPAEWTANRAPALERARATIGACLASALAAPVR